MIKRILSPFQKFIKIESFSGILLFGATIIAMLWANSPWGDHYQALWQYKLGFTFGSFELIKPLILWVNDGLMALFFFLIGLEIKRELLVGELNTFRKAVFPLFAAIGGMFVPLAVFLILNTNPDTQDGWGIPMATDIAFSLAIIQLLGKRVPLSLKIFLTAFAIVDDLGAVLVIAIFYSGGIKGMLLVYALVVLAILVVVSMTGKYKRQITAVGGIIIWVLFLKAGIHPTIAGVLVAFTVPLRNLIDDAYFTDRFSQIATSLQNMPAHEGPLLPKTQAYELDELKKLIRKFKPRLQYLEHKIHQWSAYFIMPVFALANAGVVISMDMTLDTSLVWNIGLALIVGKTAGIVLLSFLAVKLGVASLPEGVNFRQIFGVAVLAGVGFTMSIFIANLAFSESAIYIDSAKIGIIAGSLISGVLAYIILRMSAGPGTAEEGASELSYTPQQIVE